jgi:hypothetical protein
MRYRWWWSATNDNLLVVLWILQREKKLFFGHHFQGFIEGWIRSSSSTSSCNLGDLVKEEETNGSRFTPSQQWVFPHSRSTRSRKDSSKRKGHITFFIIKVNLWCHIHPTEDVIKHLPWHTWMFIRRMGDARIVSPKICPNILVLQWDEGTEEWTAVVYLLLP